MKICSIRNDPIKLILSSNQNLINFIINYMKRPTSADFFPRYLTKSSDYIYSQHKKKISSSKDFQKKIIFIQNSIDKTFSSILKLPTH